MAKTVRIEETHEQQFSPATIHVTTSDAASYVYCVRLTVILVCLEKVFDEC